MFELMSVDANLTRIEEEMRRFWQWYDMPAAVRNSHLAGPPFRILQQPLETAGQGWAEEIRLLAAADLLARYHSMRGEQVLYQAAWASHGLALEVAVEHALRPAAGGYDLERFNSACRQRAVEGQRHGEMWAELLGVWLDRATSHSGLTPQSIGAVWGILRRLWDAGRFRQERKVVPVCPRCATPLSEAEARQRSVQVEAQAVWVRLPWENEAETYFLAWTDAAWTLVGMVALAVHPSAEYAVVEVTESEDLPPVRLLLAESALGRSIQMPHRLVRRLTGKALRGARYRPLFTFHPAEQGTGRVTLSTEVPLDVGTGLLPVVPAFDAASLTIAEAQGLAAPELLDDWGSLDDPVTQWRGLSPLDAESLLVEDLRVRGLLYRTKAVARSRAQCPYCGTALLPLARTVWEVLLDGRTWTIGRDRTWGVPLPVWICEQCGAKSCVAGLDDLAHRSGSDASRMELHRPTVDRVVLPCQTCGGSMRRVSAVVDANFEAALSPWATGAGPGPADLAVGLGNGEGWLAAANEISALLTGAPAWSQALALPEARHDVTWDAAHPALSDALRWGAYTGASTEEAEHTFVRPLWRLAIELFARQEAQPGPDTAEPSIAPDPGVDAQPQLRQQAPQKASDLLDRWLLARVHQALSAVSDLLDRPDPRGASRELAALVEAVSCWYLPYRSGSGVDVLGILERLVAPFVPHLAEAIHRMRGARTVDSVHLRRWPVPDPGWEDSGLLDLMARTQRFAALGRAARARAGLEPDQELAQAVVGPMEAELADLETWGSAQELLARVLGVSSVQLVEGIPTQVGMRLRLNRGRAARRDVSADDIDASLAELPPDRAAQLALQVWDGFSVSVGVQGLATTLLHEEVEIIAQARPGWIAEAEPGRIVALRNE